MCAAKVIWVIVVFVNLILLFVYSLLEHPYWPPDCWEKHRNLQDYVFEQVSAVFFLM